MNPRSDLSVPLGKFRILLSASIPFYNAKDTGGGDAGFVREGSRDLSPPFAKEGRIREAYVQIGQPLPSTGLTQTLTARVGGASPPTTKDSDSHLGRGPRGLTACDPPPHHSVLPRRRVESGKVPRRGIGSRREINRTLWHRVAKPDR